MSALSNRVLFSANATPFVKMQIEVCHIQYFESVVIEEVLDYFLQIPSSICSYETINYTIIIGNVDTSDVVEFGPIYHRGSGIVSHDIVSGLRRDTEYSMRVVVFTLFHKEISYTHAFSEHSKTKIVDTHSHTYNHTHTLTLIHMHT